MRCLGCGYRLEHAAGERCPECGRGFDRREPSTVQMQPVRGLRILGFAWLGLALFMLTPTLLLLDEAMQRVAAGPGRPVDHDAGLPIWVILLTGGPITILGGFAVAGIFAYRALDGLRGQRSGWVTHRWACWLALLPAALIAMVFLWRMPMEGLKRLMIWMLGS